MFVINYLFPTNVVYIKCCVMFIAERYCITAAWSSMFVFDCFLSFSFFDAAEKGLVLIAFSPIFFKEAHYFKKILSFFFLQESINEQIPSHLLM